MLVYCNNITNRLRYIAGFISQTLYERECRFTDDAGLFRNSTGIKINYSREKIAEDEFTIEPVDLLFENHIAKQHLELSEVDGLPVFYKNPGEPGFDIFAASFYLISRYEEYLPHAKDKYGRYAFENSLAYKNGFLERPLVNEWINFLGSRLLERFPNETPQYKKGRRFKFIPTYDIDEAWSYKHKSTFRKWAASARNVLNGQFDILKERRKVNAGLAVDPFESYQWMNELHAKYKLTPVYFFLVADKTGKFDRNILPKEPALQELIRQQGTLSRIGIHPSWQSGDNPALIKEEISYLARTAGVKINTSRQHFIRFTLPETFRNLLDAGISEDYSMGYGTVNGFRASISSPYYWFDLEQNRQTPLLVHPFCFMDANAFFEKGMKPEQATQEMKHYYERVKQVDGTFISIWHNTFLGTAKLFKGWREAYEKFLQEIFTTKL